MVGGTNLLSTQMQRAGVRGLELCALLPGRPHAHQVPSPGKASPAQHLGAVGRLREVEGGGASILLLRERQVGSQHSMALGTHPSYLCVPAPAHLYVLHGLGGGGGLQQGHGAAAKATTSHAAAVNPRCRQRSLDELVQLRTAHLIVIPVERTEDREGLAWSRPRA